MIPTTEPQAWEAYRAACAARRAALDAVTFDGPEETWEVWQAAVNAAAQACEVWKRLAGQRWGVAA